MPANVFLNGQTALSPAMQDVMRGNEDYYKRNLASIEQDMQIEQVKGVAGIGAERLAQYGPQGKWWAERLQADPIAAYAAAEKFGGFQAIEQQLQRAHAAGQEARLGNPMAGTEYQSWIEGGAAGLNNLATGRANDSLASQRMATAEAMRGILEGSQGTGLMGEGDLGTTNYGALSALAMVKPEIVRAQLAIQKAARQPGEQAVGELQGIARPFIKQLAQTAQDWEFVRDAAFVGSGQNDAWLLKLYVRAVEPGLMVTQAESGDVVRSTTSDLGQLSTRIMRTLTPAGLMTPTTRRLLAESIDSAFRARSTAQLEFMDGLEAEASGLLQGQPAGINVQRALIGDDAPRNDLAEKIATPFNFESIGPAYMEPVSTEPTRAKPAAKHDSRGNVVEPVWDPEMGEWYWDLE